MVICEHIDIGFSRAGPQVGLRNQQPASRAQCRGLTAEADPNS